jgi:hypothetical protein
MSLPEAAREEVREPAEDCGGVLGGWEGGHSQDTLSSVAALWVICEHPVAWQFTGPGR